MTNNLNDGVRDSHLPEGYDINKEPIARYRLRREREYRPLSGFGYVVARLDDETVAGRVLISGKRLCDHGTTICDGQTETGSWCVDEWQYDWNLLWSRTAGGRRLISAVGVDHDKHQNPNHPARKFRDQIDAVDQRERQSDGIVADKAKADTPPFKIEDEEVVVNPEYEAEYTAADTHRDRYPSDGAARHHEAGTGDASGPSDGFTRTLNTDLFGMGVVAVNVDRRA